MATESEQRQERMVLDHEKRLKRLEKAMAEGLRAQEIEAEIAEQHPQTMPGGGKKK